ncbi:ubiquinone anaerobic biosynthesis accessory factor UbiT [Ferrimonas marina]|uniref:SCP-2 sterol transfer family protein n=1 Tax=Ferrimonas marina TaxID=299255 RepID=A0A1M5YGH1_9GAMM|nr:SCP2 sterol-binding domain-containing protein [Ferrimonas marina]SHI11062.1 SCP-2 sterol transfer family protein [Ferrimonas marina]
MNIFPPLAPVKALLLPLLQQHFATPAEQGELAFLTDRRVELAAFELPWPIELGWDGQRFQLSWPSGSADAKLSGSLGALAQVGLGKADPDALFFQRKLTMEGDTELALEVKSLLSRYPLLSLLNR